MSELLKPITRHDICSAINAASNERFVPYSVHFDLKAKYEKAVSALKWYKKERFVTLKLNKLTDEDMDQINEYCSGDVATETLKELGEK